MSAPDENKAPLATVAATRDGECERGSLAQGAPHRELAAHAAGQIAADRETEPHPLVHAR